MSKSIQDLKASLQFSQAYLDELKATKACSIEKKIQVMSDSLANYLTNVNNLSAWIIWRISQEETTC